jgi:transcriptional regulator with XRE-family HTH domain
MPRKKGSRKLNPLKKARLRAGITAAKLSELAEISPTTVSRLENGKKARLDTLAKIAKALNIDVELLEELAEDGEEKPANNLAA